MIKLLIIDDNKQITSILEEYAKIEGYTTFTAVDGSEGVRMFEAEKPDVILLDVMMPKMDGFEVCREIRKTSQIPILMITARGEDFEKIMGLEIGADDYIVKPFSPGEVMARIKAILRRVTRDEKNSHIFKYGSLVINIEDYTVSIDNAPVILTKKEIELLWTLATNRKKVFTRDNLLNSLWGYDYYGDSRTVDSHIKRLRAKLDHYSHPEWDIKTIWGVGYRFEVAAND